MPFAIEPNAVSPLDIPAPIVSIPASNERGAGSAPSFQDHLVRAGSTSDAASAGSRTAPADRRQDEVRRSDDAGDRAEAERRDEASAERSTAGASESQASDTGEVKPKADDDEQVHGRKKGTSSDEKHEKKQGEEATTVVVAAVVVQDAVPKDEVTLGDEAAATETVDPAIAAAGEKGKQGAGGKESKLDPTKIVGGPVDPKVGETQKAEAATDPTLAAAAEAVEEPIVVQADAAPVVDVPHVSNMHSLHLQAGGDKKEKSQGDGEAAGSKVGEATTVAAIAGDHAVSDSPVAQSKEVADPIVGEKGSGKQEAEAQAKTEGDFATQLQGGVEAAVAATSTGTTTAETSVAADAAPTTTVAKADSSTTGPSSKANNTQAAAAELARSASSNNLGAGRVAGDDGRQSGGLSAADRARLVQRVARAVRTAQDRGGELQIRLSPPELGQLRLQVQMTDGTLSARIEAETPHAKQVITESLGILRERLAEQNIRVDRIEVDLMNNGNGGSPNMPDRRNDFSHEGPTPRGFGNNMRGGDTGDAAPTTTRSVNTAPSGDGGLNVVI